VYPGGETVQDLQVHQGHAEHVLGRGLLGRSRGGGEYSTINDIILYAVWKGKKRFHKNSLGILEYEKKEHVLSLLYSSLGTELAISLTKMCKKK
jgi:hypothetical protein